MLKIAVIPGDGVGEEVTAQAAKVLNSIKKISKINFKLKYFNLGGEHYLKTGEVISDKTKDEISKIEELSIIAETAKRKEHLEEAKKHLPKQ